MELVWKKTLKSRCEVTVNLEFVIALKNGKVYERETFFIEKMRQFLLESYMNVDGKERKNRGENNVTKKLFLNVSFAARDRAHGNEKVYSSKFLVL